MKFSRSKKLLLAVVNVAIVGTLDAQAVGHVYLYKNSDLKDRIASIKGVIPEVCYNLCNELNDVVSSAKWGDLPKGKRGRSTVLFFTEKDCDTSKKWKSWLVETQIDDLLLFPSLFTLDGMNDAISSFKVSVGGGHRGTVDYCKTESASLNVTNGARTDARGEESVAIGNDTAGYL